MFPVGVLFGEGGEELSGEEVAEGVGGEVAEVAEGPVDVLQASERIFGGDDAEIRLHFGVPRFGKVVDAELARDKLFFNLKAQNDVEAVGHLVGFDADEAGGDFIDAAVESVEGDAFEDVGESFLKVGIEKAAEGKAAADEGFPPARLALVHTEGDGLREGSAPGVDGNAHLIHRVSRFMEDREDVAHEVVGDDASGDAAVVGMERHRKGVARDVEARVGGVDGKLGGDEVADFRLFIGVDFAVEKAVVDVAGGCDFF